MSVHVFAYKLECKKKFNTKKHLANFIECQLFKIDDGIISEKRKKIVYKFFKQI